MRFDYSANDGKVAIGAGDNEFQLRFGKCSDLSIYLYKDGTNLQRIARIKGAQSNDIIQLRNHDSSSWHYTIRAGEHFMAENDKGFFLQGYIVEILDDTRGAERDGVRFDYEIGDVGQSAFHALGPVVLPPPARPTGNAPESCLATSLARDLSVAEVMDRIEEYHLPPVVPDDGVTESIIRIFLSAAKNGEITVRGQKEGSAIVEAMERDYWRTMTLQATRVLHRYEDGVEIQTSCSDPRAWRSPPIYRSMVVERAQIDAMWPIKIRHHPTA